MTLKTIQRALLDARIPAKIYETQTEEERTYETVLLVRCRFRDRWVIREALPKAPRLSYTFRYTLMPWECRSLLKVVAYVE